MRPGESRRLAKEHSLEELKIAASGLTEDREPAFEVRGQGTGEKLTHLLLAVRIRTRIDGGQEEREAFRAVMAEVRSMFQNE